MNLLKSALAIAAAFGVIGAANATPVDDLFSARTGTFLLTDTSGEILVKGGQNTGGLTIQTGDYLVGALNFESLSNPLSSISPTNTELTGVFATQIGAITASGVVSEFSMQAAGTTFWEDNFGPIATALSAMGIDLNKVAGLLFDDSSINFDRGNGITSGFANATNGALRAVIGFDGVDDFWIARGPSSISTFSTPGSATNPLGHFNAGLSFLYENLPGSFLAQDASLDADALDLAGYDSFSPIASSADVLIDGALFRPTAANSGVTDPFPVYNKTDISLNRIPEPSTLALLGLGLFGFGLGRRAKK